MNWTADRVRGMMLELEEDLCEHAIRAGYEVADGDSEETGGIQLPRLRRYIRPAQGLDDLYEAHRLVFRDAMLSLISRGVDVSTEIAC